MPRWNSARKKVISNMATQHNDSLLRFMTCGSVDDGKSTLIGRLLYDTKTILADTLNNIARTSQKRGMEAVDLSLLTDGLQAEREQGITIDVAYRYFSTGTRKYIIADAPGHEQYTRNMVTAASTANLAIILIDARKGVLTQTRRHSYLAHLVGIPHIVVAVNKMDLVNYDQAVYEKIKADYIAFATEIGLAQAREIKFMPMSALNGDMLVDRLDNMPWYQGETLIDILEAAPAAHSEQSEAFRFPVQFVCRPHDSANPDLHDFRGFMGRVEAGEISVGDAVTVLPNGYQSKVKAIQLGAEQLQSAQTEQSVTLLLEDEIDTSRGDMIVKTSEAPEAVKQIEAHVCWLSETPLSPARTYIVRHTTRESKAKIGSIQYKVDVNTLEHLASADLKMNDIARVTFKLAQPLMVDSYDKNRATGAFIVIDESSNNTVGAGMIV
ncbi:sulfate adenylyltransferase subunit CysN [Methylophilus medardicus]|uniref:sulfate adenylyltransferase n=2 Tax=Methylophilus medardicus TaxID=2588534 RepID=A0A5B8CRS1_9PROT|nr:sulfate adenylyltransferase subunit CysN [Methylophilus medardicus]QDC48876.1 sulfate adenylyltransferase subunit CysN [Methylophilus medardicus]QDC52581.1 sulfate adenylyltransferase subunit CysN [Methylophilus medardicus]